MVKSASHMITKLKDGVDYAKFKAWLSALRDWVESHSHLTPDQLGPASLRAIIRISIDPELYDAME